MKTKLFFIALCLVNLLACKKTESTPSSLHYQFPQQFLDYAFLPLDKQLTYKDSASGNENVVNVTENEMSTITVTPDFFGLQGSPINYDVYDLKLTNLSNGSTWLNAEAKCEGQSTVVMNDSLSSILWYPFPVEIIPSIVIGNNTYNDVIKASSNNGLSISDPHYVETHYYWAKGAGIVKRTVVNGNNIKTETLE